MTVEQVAEGVFRGTGTDVNFWLIRDGADVTLVDAGYPGDVSTVEAAMRAIGSRPEDVQAILLTHAHVDHIGATVHFHEQYGTPTFTGRTEAAHARREFLEQAGPAAVIRNVWRPGVLPWALRVARAGAAKPFAVPFAAPFTTQSGALDLPGRPVAVPMAGHTSGHTAYHLPQVGAVLTGDGLVTGHPLSKRTGPQLLPAMFHHGDARAGLASIEALDADRILPGHGDPLTMPVQDAVARARD